MGQLTSRPLELAFCVYCWVFILGCVREEAHTSLALGGLASMLRLRR